MLCVAQINPLFQIFYAVAFTMGTANEADAAKEICWHFSFFLASYQKRVISFLCISFAVVLKRNIKSFFVFLAMGEACAGLALARVFFPLLWGIYARVKACASLECRGERKCVDSIFWSEVLWFSNERERNKDCEFYFLVKGAVESFCGQDHYRRGKKVDTLNVLQIQPFHCLQGHKQQRPALTVDLIWKNTP